MTIEIMKLLTVVSILFGIYGTYNGIMSGKKKEDKTDATEMATITAKLETISNNTLEIKNEIKSIKEETKENRERLIRLEESVKSAWKRINMFEGNKITTEDDGK